MLQSPIWLITKLSESDKAVVARLTRSSVDVDMREYNVMHGILVGCQARPHGILDSIEALSVQQETTGIGGKHLDQRFNAMTTVIPAAIFRLKRLLTLCIRYEPAGARSSLCHSSSLRSSTEE